MKKFDLKSVVMGIVIGTISMTTVFATGGIKSATYSSAKVYFNGETVPLKNSLVSITKEGSSKPQLYMPMKDVLEYMHFDVKWNSTNQSVNLTMKGSNPQEVDFKSLSENEVDEAALDIMQRTGNWSYIESYLPHMSKKGIKGVVDLYNSKHQNPSEHKNAVDYTN